MKPMTPEQFQLKIARTLAALADKELEEAKQNNLNALCIAALTARAEETHDAVSQICKIMRDAGIPLEPEDSGDPY